MLLLEICQGETCKVQCAIEVDVDYVGDTSWRLGLGVRRESKGIMWMREEGNLVDDEKCRTNLPNALQIQFIRLPVARALRHGGTANCHIDLTVLVVGRIEQREERLVVPDVGFHVRNAAP